MATITIDESEFVTACIRLMQTRERLPSAAQPTPEAFPAAGSLRYRILKDPALALSGIEDDLSHAIAGNRRILAEYEQSRQELARIRSDLAAVGRLLREIQ